MTDTAKPPTRAEYDPDPIPDEPWRHFAAVALGDFQTANSYLGNGLIRLGSMDVHGEKFTAFEQRALEAVLQDLAETLPLAIAAYKAQNPARAL